MSGLGDIGRSLRRQVLIAVDAWWPTVRGFLKALAEAGTEGYPPDTKRRLMILNMISYLIAVTTAIYSVQNSFMDYERYRPVILLNTALFFVMLTVPFLHRFGDIAAAMVILTSEYIALFLFTAMIGRSSGLHLQFFVVAAAAFVVLGLDRIRLILLVIAGAAVLHLTAWFWFPRSAALIDAEREVLDALYIQAALTTFALIAASVYYAFRLAEKARAETDSILRNILPDSVVERLKAEPGRVIADSFPKATILFADISGFVALARRLGAEETVALLNAIVTEFDALAEHHGVEKIKTIGDAYMVASGLPVETADHVHRLARMALDMQSVIERVAAEKALDLRIRIGMASGPVMAGVIGRRKFTYDIWGDAVNLAARLEGLSQPGRILVCPQCGADLGDGFVLEPRGEVEIKGLGPRETWFLVGSR